jgi:hypothetical protein
VAAALRRELDGRPAIAIASIAGALGAVGLVVCCIVNPERAFAAYLAAWCAVATTVLGGFVVLLIGYAASARWPAAVRRMCEAITAGLVPVALLGIPLFVFAGYVWPWADVAGVPHSDEVKRVYLALPFFDARAALYFVLAIVPAELLLRWSRRRDANPEPPVPHGVDAMNRERKLASAMLPVMGLALTFAAFDWLMSLDPNWWSSAFGLYIICGAMLAGMAMTILLAWRGVATRAMPLPTGVFHAMGRLQHAFVILWAYIAYFQAMLIQIANKPSEAKFFVDRNFDGWRIVTALVFCLLFAVPFPLLMPRRLKRRAGYLAAIAIMLLVGHYLQMWWLVVPRVSQAPIPAWSDLAAIAAIAGITTAVATWRMRGVPLLPVGDPYLADALAYETTT